MFLADLCDEDFENIANNSSSSSDNIGLVFFDFRIRLLSQVLNLGLNPYPHVTPNYIAKTLKSFNQFYCSDLLLNKGYHQVQGEIDFDSSPEVELIKGYLSTINCKEEKPLLLYAFGLIFVWDQINNWSFAAISEARFQQDWFASFYLRSNEYFLSWEPLVIASEVKKSLSKSNSKAVKVRHKKSGLTKEYAIKLYSERKFKSIKQAALEIAPEVINFGVDKGFHFSTSHQAVETIYKWLRSSNNNP